MHAEKAFKEQHVTTRRQTPPCRRGIEQACDNGCLSDEVNCSLMEDMGPQHLQGMDATSAHGHKTLYVLVGMGHVAYSHTKYHHTIYTIDARTRWR